MRAPFGLWKGFPFLQLLCSFLLTWPQKLKAMVSKARIIKRGLFWPGPGDQNKWLKKMSWKKLASRSNQPYVTTIVQSCLTLCNPMNCSTAGFPVLHSFPESIQLMSVESVIPSNLSSSVTPLLPALNLSQHQGLFQWVGSSHQAEYWSFSFSISPSSEYSGSAAFRIKSFSLPQHFASQIHSLACCVESRANELGLSNKRASPRILEFWLQNHKMMPKTMEVTSGKYQSHLSLNDLFTVKLHP